MKYGSVACAAAVTAIWLATGVRGSEIARYAGYLLVFIAVPGMLVHRAVSGRRELFADVCVGVPLGFALQIAGYVAMASLGWPRFGLFASPCIGLAAGVIVWRRRDTPRGGRIFSPGAAEVICIALLIIAAIAMLALRHFPDHPLPRDIGAAGAKYYRDMPWHLGNIVELTHAWPFTNPRLAGEPVRYHIGGYVFTAGTARITGIDAATLLLRLDPALLILLTCLQLVWLGCVAGGRVRTGIVVLFLVMFAGDASSLARATSPLFLNNFVPHLYRSPTYLMALVLFIPLVGLGSGLITGTPGRRDWTTWLLFLPACGLSKLTTLPVLAAGACGYAVLQLVRDRTLARRPLLMAAAAVSAFVMVGLVALPASSAGMMVWRPLGSVYVSQAWKQLRDWGGAPAIAMAVLVLAGHAPMLLAGTVAFFATRRTLAPGQVWLLMLAAAGATVSLLFVAPGNSQMYFWFFGYVAAGVVAAIGVVALIESPQAPLRRAVLIFVSTAALISAMSVVFMARPGVRLLLGDRFRMFQQRPDNQVPAPPPDVTAELSEGLRWVATRSEPRAVLAVNSVTPPFYFSALTERRVWLEDAFPGESYAVVSKTERESVVRRLFTSTSLADVCATARPLAIDYLVDVAHPSTGLRSMLATSELPPVFENSAVRILSLAACRTGSQRTPGRP
jgi:hypothetical protein